MIRGTTNGAHQLSSPRRLLLVRHGLPDYHLGKSGDIPPGPVLSHIGHAQAQQAAGLVAEYAPTTIYHSPLARTRQTAQWVAQASGAPLRMATDLREWHRTERLYNVNVRLGRWLRGWFESGEQCAAVVSHASPLLSLLRAALYFPHFGWYHGKNWHQLQLHSNDRFEVSMASVFELEFTSQRVTARCLFHPEPRIVHAADNQYMRRFPRPSENGEGAYATQRLMPRLIGWSM